MLADLEPVVQAAVARGVVPVMPRLGYIFGVVFDFDDANVSDSQIDALEVIVAEHLRGRPDVAAAYTTADLQTGSDTHDPWLGRHQRSFYPRRAPAVTVHAVENYLITPEERGASHGSPYAYDARVPLIFLGEGIESGEYRGDVRTVDIAPTLATLLGIEPPDDLDGKALTLQPKHPD